MSGYGEWVVAAACRDPRLPIDLATVTEKHLSGPSRQLHPGFLAARAVCQRCPVLADCQAWVLDPGTMDVAGVVAGLAESDRRELRRKAA